MTRGAHRSRQGARAALRPVRPVSLKRWGAALLAVTCLSPLGAAAQTTWQGITSTYSTPGNWSAGVPSSTGTGIFTNTGTPAVTGVGGGGVSDVGTWQFRSGAPAYTFAVSNDFTFNVGGIVNNSAQAPAITIGNSGRISFANSSGAGDATFTNNAGFAPTTGLAFNDSSTAGTATIINNGPMFFRNSSTANIANITNNGLLIFSENSSAGSAVIVNSGPASNISFRDMATAGSATITTNGGAFSTFGNNATAGNARLIVTAGSNLQFFNNSTASNATITSTDGSIVFENNSTAGSAAIVNQGGALIQFLDSTSAGNASITNNGGGTATIRFLNTSTAGNATITNNRTLSFSNSSTAGNASIVNNAVVDFSNTSTAGNATIVENGFLAFHDSSSAGSASITNNGGTGVVFEDTSTAGNATITNNFSMTFGNSSTAGNATITTNSGATTNIGSSASGGSARFIVNGTGALDISLLTTGGTTAGSIEGGGNVRLGANTLTVGGNNLSTTFSGAIQVGGIGGALVKAGSGTLTLSGNNTYNGGTTVTAGLINFTSASNFGTGAITLAGGGLQWASGSTADISSKLAPLGAGGGTFDTNGNTITFASGLTGSGGLAKQGLGTLNLTGNNTYSGGTAVLAGTLAVNGSIAGNVAVGSAGTLGGNGTIGGNVVNAGTLAPGNSIGLMTVNGSYTQVAGSFYQVEANAAGQADRINVGGVATIQGGTVQVLAQPGNYGPSTTYTIVRATGGVSGTYAGVSSNFAFLTPSLSYDANDVYLTLALPSQNAFTPTFLALTPNQKAVGTALNQSFANASGDFATVIGALAGLSTAQGPVALDTISGQPYADFGTMNTNNAALFMNALGQQMANARGAASTGQRQALAQACEIESCDAVGPLSAWASALGGLGSVLGDSNASTLTYNFGGAAAGIDYRFDPRFLAGLGVGYTHGTQWVNSFMGQGWSDSVSVAAYGSFTQSGFYLDALAGYAYYSNQLQRQILIPGLQQRTATGSTGANQFLGQIEGGYKVDVYAPASATITPFGRFQISSVTQNAFSESGAQSLSLNVAQQTTNSQRTTIGADLGSSIGLGNERKLDLEVRLGWQHEFADTGRPITAAFAGAPGNSFTVFGATPARDAAVVGLQATTHIAEATQVYLRYDGGVGGGTDNHALNVGVRMSW
jgi:outer membrane autotransporter protein